jgi:dihydroflavonol-4-reductase
MAGVDAILHVASPLGHENANDIRLIKEAVAGVEHVFEAAHIAGVKRIVMTSSQAAAPPPLLRRQDLSMNIFGLILKILN